MSKAIVDIGLYPRHGIKSVLPLCDSLWVYAFLCGLILVIMSNMSRSTKPEVYIKSHNAITSTEKLTKHAHVVSEMWTTCPKSLRSDARVGNQTCDLLIGSTVQRIIVAPPRHPVFKQTPREACPLSRAPSVGRAGFKGAGKWAVAQGPPQKQ